MQQLANTKARNEMIMQKNRDRKAKVKKDKEEQEKRDKDKADKLAPEAERKAEKANKKKWVSAMLSFTGLG